MMAIIHLTTDWPLVVWYASWAMAILGLAVICYLGFRQRREVLLGWLAYLLLWMSIDLFARALLRAPVPMWAAESALYVSRFAPVCEAIYAFLVLDRFFAMNNGHLDLPRRLLRWWDRRSQRWEDRQHA